MSGNKTENSKSAAEEGVDRLSNLPDAVLHHILSFLLTHQAVQTSVLSTRWTNLWTSLPVLNFQTDPFSFSNTESFNQLILSVLNRRDYDAKVSKFRFFSSRSLPESLIEMLLNYAVAHNVDHLIMEILLISEYFLDPLFLCQSLKTLELIGFCITRPFSFTILTSLQVKRCAFDYVANECFDFLASCPSLTKLVLDCNFIRGGFEVFKISGLQLVYLSLAGINYCWDGLPENCKVEICAPKLKHLCYTYSEALDFSVINLPSLQSVDISIINPYQIGGVGRKYKKKSCLNLLKLLQLVNNAEYVTLRSSTIVTLSKVTRLDCQPSPQFSRLKFLKIQYKPDCNPSDMPEELMTYLLVGAPSEATVLFEVKEVLT